MALDALFNSLKALGAVNYAPGSPLGVAMNRLYNALADEDRYVPENYITALKSLHKVI